MRAAQDGDGTSGNVGLRRLAISILHSSYAHDEAFTYDYAKSIPQRGAESLEFRLRSSGQYCPHRKGIEVRRGRGGSANYTIARAIDVTRLYMERARDRY